MIEKQIDVLTRRLARKVDSLNWQSLSYQKEAIKKHNEAVLRIVTAARIDEVKLTKKKIILYTPEIGTATRFINKTMTAIEAYLNDRELVLQATTTKEGEEPFTYTDKDGKQWVGRAYDTFKGDTA